MALATTVTGGGNLVSKDKATRNLRDAGGTYYNQIETTESEVREWVARTQAAATTAVANETGNALMTLTGADVTYESTASEDNRVIGSYTYTCSAEKKAITIVAPPA